MPSKKLNSDIKKPITKQNSKFVQTAKIKKCAVVLSRVSVLNYLKNINEKQSKKEIVPIQINDINVVVPVIKLKRIDISKVLKEQISTAKDKYEVKRKSQRIQSKYNCENGYVTRYNFVRKKKFNQKHSKTFAERPKSKGRPKRRMYGFAREKSKNFYSNENISINTEVWDKMEENSEMTNTQDNPNDDLENNKNTNNIEDNKEVDDENTKNQNNSYENENEDHLLENVTATEENIIEKNEELLVSSSTDEEQVVEQNTVPENINDNTIEAEQEKTIDTNLIDTTFCDALKLNESDDFVDKVEETLNLTEISIKSNELDEIVVSSSTDEDIGEDPRKTNNVCTELHTINETEIDESEIHESERINERISEHDAEYFKLQEDRNIELETDKGYDESNINENFDSTRNDFEETVQNNTIQFKLINKETQTPQSFKKLLKARAESSESLERDENFDESAPSNFINTKINEELDFESELQTESRVNTPMISIESVIKALESEDKTMEDNSNNQQQMCQQQLVQNNTILLEQMNTNTNYLEVSHTFNNNILHCNDLQTAIVTVPIQITPQICENIQITEEVSNIIAAETINNYNKFENILEPHNQILLKTHNAEALAINQNVPQVEAYQINSLQPQYTSKVLDSIQIIPPYQHIYTEAHVQENIPTDQNNHSIYNPIYQNFDAAGNVICLENYTLPPPRPTIILNENYDKLHHDTFETNIQTTSRQLNYEALETPTINHHPVFFQDNNYNNSFNNVHNLVIGNNKCYNEYGSNHCNHIPVITAESQCTTISNNYNVNECTDDYERPPQINYNSEVIQSRENNPLISNEINSDDSNAPKTIESVMTSMPKYKKHKKWSIKERISDENSFSTKIIITSNPVFTLQQQSSDELSESSSDKAAPITSSSSSRSSPSSKSLSSTCSQSTEINMLNSLKSAADHFNVNGNDYDNENHNDYENDNDNDNDNDDNNGDENNLRLQDSFVIQSECSVKSFKMDFNELVEQNDPVNRTENEEDNRTYTYEQEYNKENNESDQHDFISHKDAITEYNVNSVESVENEQNQIVSRRPSSEEAIVCCVEENQQEQSENIISDNLPVNVNEHKLNEVINNKCNVETDLEHQATKQHVEVIENENHVKETSMPTNSFQHSESPESNIINPIERDNKSETDQNSCSSSAESTNTGEIEKENIILIPRINESKDTLIAIENNELIMRMEKRNLNDDINLKPKLSNEDIVEIIDFEKDFEIEGELTGLPGHSANNVNSIIIKRKIDAVENNENKISNSQNFLPFKKRYIPPVCIKPKKVPRKKKATTTKSNNRNTKKISRPVFEGPQSSPHNAFNMIDRPIEIEILSQAQVHEISSTQVSPPHQSVRQPEPPEPDIHIIEEQMNRNESIEIEEQETRPVRQQIFEPPREQYIIEPTDHVETEDEQIQEPVYDAGRLFQDPLPEQNIETESDQDITPQKKYENLTVDLYYDSAFTDVELLAENIVKKQITEDLSKERKRKLIQQRCMRQQEKIIESSTTSSCSSSISSSCCNNPGTSNNRNKNKNKNNRKKNLKTDINNVQGEKFFRSQAGTNENTNDEFRTGLAEIIENESYSGEKLFRALMEKKKEGISKTNEGINKINEKIETEETQIMQFDLILEYFRKEIAMVRKKKETRNINTNKILMDPEISSSSNVNIETQKNKSNLEASDIQNLLNSSCNSEDLFADYDEKEKLGNKNSNEKENKLNTFKQKFFKIFVKRENFHIKNDIKNNKTGNKKLVNKVEFKTNKSAVSVKDIHNKKLKTKLTKPKESQENIAAKIRSSKEPKTVSNQITNKKELRSKTKTVDSEINLKKEPKEIRTNKIFNVSRNPENENFSSNVKVLILNEKFNKHFKTPVKTNSTSKHKIAKNEATKPKTHIKKNATSKKSNIFEFSASQSSSSNCDDPTKDVIKDMVKAGKVQLVKYKKGTGKLPTKFRNRTKSKKPQASNEIEHKENKPSNNVQKKNNDFNQNMENQENLNFNQNDDRFDDIDHVSIISDKNTNSIGKNNLNSIKKILAKNGVTENKNSNSNKKVTRIKDKKVLLALAKSFLRRSNELQKGKTDNKIKSNTNIEAGAASPWRGEENLPTLFNFSRNEDNLISFSSDLINPPSQIGSSNKTYMSLNHSNMENIAPSIHKSKMIIENNPRKGKPHRSPLKPINLINFPLAYNNSTPIHRPPAFNPKMTNQKVLFHNNSTKDKENLLNDGDEISHLFGFEQDIDKENYANENNYTNSISISKITLQNKLKKLKQLVPEKKHRQTLEFSRPIRYNIDKIKSIFNEPGEEQKDIREMFCSTMKEVKSKNNSRNEEEKNKAADSSVQDFDSFANKTSPINKSIRTYERPKRKRAKLRNNFVMFLDSETEEESDDQPKKKIKHRNNKRDKHDKADLESFYNDFSSMCAEIEDFAVAVE